MTLIDHIKSEGNPTKVAVQFQPIMTQAFMGKTICTVLLKDAVNPTEFFPNQLTSDIIDSTELRDVQAYCDANNILTHTLND